MLSQAQANVAAVMGEDATLGAPASGLAEPMRTEASEASRVARVCEASRACHAKFGCDFGDEPDSPRRIAWNEVHDGVTSANGYEPFQARMIETGDALEELAERVAKLDAETMAGLRTKTLVAIWENAPYIADNMSFSWGEDCGAIYSHIRSAAKITGLLPLLDHYEAAFAEVAAQIEAAGGDEWGRTPA